MKRSVCATCDGGVKAHYSLQLDVQGQHMLFMGREILLCFNTAIMFIHDVETRWVISCAGFGHQYKRVLFQAFCTGLIKEM